ncbi:hypothetical protein [Escherichia coli]|uniref:hypothetical protein n=1 Tax=Escherichia coli TaxID=562 RepID=UPI001A92D0EC|nr:hypothetical protein [Escherichia coli]MBO0256076.1 hypothetical protein [Escherichia coli]
MSTNNELLIRLARVAAKAMSLPDADIVTKLCTQLDCALAAARTACGERTAAHSTIEKAREVTNCPQGVDLQDHLKALVAENVAMQEYIKDDCWIYDTDAEQYRDAVDYVAPTSATDSILRAAEARGVEKFALMYAEEAIKDDKITIGWKARASRAASEYAELLREGKAE